MYGISYLSFVILNCISRKKVQSNWLVTATEYISTN